MKIGERYKKKHTDITFVILDIRQLRNGEKIIALGEFGSGAIKQETEMQVQLGYERDFSAEKIDSVYLEHLIVCNLIASKVCALQGIDVTNFAQVILEADKGGNYATQEKACMFWAIDEALCQLNGLEAGQVFDMLELEHDFDLEFLSKVDLMKSTIMSRKSKQMLI